MKISKKKERTRRNKPTPSNGGYFKTEENNMKSLNSKKARQELSELFSEINICERQVTRYIELMTESAGTKEWQQNHDIYLDSCHKRDKAIIELVEVYEIPDTRYWGIIHSEREANKKSILEEREKELRRNRIMYEDLGIDINN